MKLKELISFEGSSYPVFPVLIDCFGLEAAVFLCRIIWYQTDADCWIEKGIAELQQQTGLWPGRQRRARKVLEDAGVIEQRYARLEHSLRFRIVASALDRELSSFAKRQNGVSGTPKRRMPKVRNDVSSREGKTLLKTEEKTKAVFPVSIDVPAFREAWERWTVYRREIKHGLTPSTVKLQLRTFAESGVEKAIAMIDQSIENGWRGIFEPKVTGKRPPPPRPGEGKLEKDKAAYLARLNIIGGDQ